MIKTSKILLILFLFPAVVIIGGIVIAMFYGGSFFILPEEKESEMVFGNSIKPFLKAGEIARGEFKANENFLGTVSIRFKAFDRINTDTLLFRLKEKGDKRWFSENTYKVDQFTGLPFFPFGFPPISDSKGKIYIVELESLRGAPKDSIAISQERSSVQLGYFYSKGYLSKNFKVLLQFISTKITRDFPLIQVAKTIFIGEVLLCLLFTLIKQNRLTKLVGGLRNILKKYSYYNKSRFKSTKAGTVKFVSLYIILFLLILISVYMQELGIIFFLLILLTWLLIIYMFRLPTKFLFFIVLFLYVVSFFLTVFNRSQIAETIGTIIYVTLFVSSVKLLLEYNTSK